MCVVHTVTGTMVTAWSWTQLPWLQWSWIQAAMVTLVASMVTVATDTVTMVTVTGHNILRPPIQPEKCPKLKVALKWRGILYWKVVSLTYMYMYGLKIEGSFRMVLNHRVCILCYLVDTLLPWPACILPECWQRQPWCPRSSTGFGLTGCLDTGLLEPGTRSKLHVLVATCRLIVFSNLILGWSSWTSSSLNLDLSCQSEQC